MKKRFWIILLLIILAILGIGVAVFFWLRPTLYHSEIIDAKTLHASPEHKTLIEGLWHQDDHLFYRFNGDGTGHTWDVDDDISEKEATPFQWEAYKEAVMITHRLRLRGVVPRYYLIDAINAYDLRFHDAYSSYHLERVIDMDPVLTDGNDLE